MECPSAKLDMHMATMAGRQISMVLDLDRAHQAGLTLGPHDLTYLELLLLQLLQEQRDAYTEEMMKESQKRR